MNHLFCISLILSLGNNSFAEREKATLTLSRLSPEAYLVWGCKHKDAEIAARSRKLLDEHYWKVADKLLPSKYKWHPWVDSIDEKYPDRSGVIQDYLCRVQCNPMEGAPIWAKYRLATKYLIYDWLKAGKTKEEIIRMLDGMVRYEKDWILRHKEHYKFSPELLDAASK